MADHSRFAGLNSPISAVCGADGGTLLQADKTRGTVLDLDGKDDFVEVPHSCVDDVLSPEESMTISLRPNAQRPGPAFICGKVAEAGDEAKGCKLELTEEAYSPSPRSFYAGADYDVKSFLQRHISDLRVFREAIEAGDTEALD